jgi:hypothetical protein
MSEMPTAGLRDLDVNFQTAFGTQVGLRFKMICIGLGDFMVNSRIDRDVNVIRTLRFRIRFHDLSILKLRCIDFVLNLFVHLEKNQTQPNAYSNRASSKERAGRSGAFYSIPKYIFIATRIFHILHALKRARWLRRR